MTSAVALEQVAGRNRRLGLRLGLVAVVVLVVLAPFLYWSAARLCAWAGIGFNPDGVLQGDPDSSRTVRCVLSPEMHASFGDTLSFTVRERVQLARVAGHTHNVFTLENRSDQPVHIRPVHYVTPARAATAFAMTQCFCYNDMTLQPGERVELPVVYGFDARLDPRVSDALLQYKLEPIEADEMRPISEIGDQP